MLSSVEIRQKFLDYFKLHGHMVEPGASLVPVNDPTLLWINSGVAALKKYFDGREKPQSNRICNAQKSLRTNDIENVGKTARHHTFFEMLGNFSIGDYFKKEAIPFAYEFLTSPEWMNLDPSKLYVTVYTDDTEAYDIWVNDIGFNPEHILKTEGNYWQIGDGPCGPDTEIFYDRGSKYDPENLGEKLFFEELENDRYIEVWNVVFSQYDGKEGVDRHLYKELPQKNIDTGMGLERLVSIVQDGETNFDTDLFLPIIREIETISKIDYKTDPMAYRVISDHIRTVTFALSDGALFANEGRGYVLRRILRRAVRFGKRIGIEGAFMYRLVDVVCTIMNDFYPYLNDQKELVAKLVKNEELRFHQTLNDGEVLLQQALTQSSDKKLSGEVIFKLYDTYGFPVELTQEIADDQGFAVDLDGFKSSMKQQQERARNARSTTESMHSQSEDLMNFTTPSEFVGYAEYTTKATVIACFKDGQQVDILDEEGYVIFDRTCFYAESGGQVADKGVCVSETFKAQVLDVQKAPHKQHLHKLQIDEGEIRVGDHVVLSIDVDSRMSIMKNHSSAHLLQSALKEIIGDHIHQAGSYVNDQYMRFDFTHYEKVTAEQLSEIERLVNHWIAQASTVTVELLPIEEAKQSGATALFDEKYGDIVRVVTMGNVSKEFCGGTHVNNIAEIGVFRIIAEESIGSGVRRITAETSFKAYQSLKEFENRVNSIRDRLKANTVSQISERLLQLSQEIETIKRENQTLVSKNIVAHAKELLPQMLMINGVPCLFIDGKGYEVEQLKQLVDVLRQKMDSYFIFAYLLEQEKSVFIASSSSDNIEKGIKAGPLVKGAAQLAGGNGGGRDDFAQAGGKKIENIETILNFIKDKLA